MNQNVTLSRIYVTPLSATNSSSKLGHRVQMHAHTSTLGLKVFAGPAITCSPDSPISQTTRGSDFAIFFSPSTSFGKSRPDHALDPQVFIFFFSFLCTTCRRKLFPLALQKCSGIDLCRSQNDGPPHTPHAHTFESHVKKRVPQKTRYWASQVSVYTDPYAHTQKHTTTHWGGEG